VTELSVFVPSRGRPDAAEELVAAFRLTCERWTECVVVVDENDPELAGYLAIHDPYGRVVVQPPPSRRGMVEPLNAAVRTEASGWAVGFMGDDHRPRTEGWDHRFLAVLEKNGPGLVYGNDLWQGERLATHVVAHGDLVRAVGYFSPPELEHLYVDRVWMDWGRAIHRLFYLPDIVIEHLHPDAGKAERDENYEAVNNEGIAARDKRAYQDYRTKGLAADVAKLRAVTRS